jgi:hypothetical protein
MKIVRARYTIGGENRYLFLAEKMRRKVKRGENEERTRRKQGANEERTMRERGER